MLLIDGGRGSSGDMLELVRYLVKSYVTANPELVYIRLSGPFS